MQRGLLAQQIAHGGQASLGSCIVDKMHLGKTYPEKKHNIKAFFDVLGFEEYLTCTNMGNPTNRARITATNFNARVCLKLAKPVSTKMRAGVGAWIAIPIGLIFLSLCILLGFYSYIRRRKELNPDGEYCGAEIEAGGYRKM